VRDGGRLLHFAPPHHARAHRTALRYGSRRTLHAATVLCTQIVSVPMPPCMSVTPELTVSVCCVPLLSLLCCPPVPAVPAVQYLVPYWCKTYVSDPSKLPPGQFERLKRGRERRVSKLLKLVLFTMFCIYPTESSRILNMYVCREVEGVSYLVQDFNVVCYDAKWQSYLIPNIIMIAIYPVGIPLFFAALLFANRKKLGELRTRVRIGFLYDGYASDMWWFELADMFHKLMLTSVVTFLPKFMLIPSGMTLSMGYLFIILLFRPYFRKGDDRLHGFAQVELYLLMLAAYIFFDSSGSYDVATDVTISVFLIIVIVGFIGLFVSQCVTIAV
jgi:hypothetical protein